MKDYFRHDGQMGKGFARVLRDVRRTQAQERNARTVPERRKKARR